VRYNLGYGGVQNAEIKPLLDDKDKIEELEKMLIPIA
jgi:hypothetical protein